MALKYPYTNAHNSHLMLDKVEQNETAATEALTMAENNQNAILSKIDYKEYPDLKLGSDFYTTINADFKYIAAIYFVATDSGELGGNVMVFPIRGDYRSVVIYDEVGKYPGFFEIFTTGYVLQRRTAQYDETNSQYTYYDIRLDNTAYTNIIVFGILKEQ